MKTKLSCEASFKFQELKRWKRSFPARHPSNSKSWRDKRYFRARHPSNSKSWRDENEAFVRGILQIPRGQELNASLQCSSSNAQSVWTHAKHNSTASSEKRKSHLKPSVTLHAQFEQDFTAKRRRPKPSRKRAYFSPQRKLRLPEKTQCFMQILTFKSHTWVMKTKLSCEASFKLQKLKRWKRSFRARHPSNSKSWRDENEAFVRGILQIPRGQELNASLQCSSSNAQSVSTHAKHNSTASSEKRKSHLKPPVTLHAEKEQDFTAKRRRPKPSRKRAYFFSATEAPFTRKNTMFHANPNIQIASMIHENEPFVRSFLQIPRIS